MVGTTSFESVDAAKVGILPLLTLLKVVKPKEIANYAHKSLADSLDLYREKKPSPKGWFHFGEIFVDIGC